MMRRFRIRTEVAFEIDAANDLEAEEQARQMIAQAGLRQRGLIQVQRLISDEEASRIWAAAAEDDGHD